MNHTISGDYIKDNLYVLPINRNYTGNDRMLFYNWLMFSDEALNLPFQVEVMENNIHITIFEFVTSSSGGSYFQLWQDTPGSSESITGSLRMRLQGVTLN